VTASIDVMESFAAGLHISTAMGRLLTGHHLQIHHQSTPTFEDTTLHLVTEVEFSRFELVMVSF
jgi:hypothetical protein